MNGPLAALPFVFTHCRGYAAAVLPPLPPLLCRVSNICRVPWPTPPPLPAPTPCLILLVPGMDSTFVTKCHCHFGKFSQQGDM